MIGGEEARVRSSLAIALKSHIKQLFLNIFIDGERISPETLEILINVLRLLVFIKLNLFNTIIQYFFSKFIKVEGWQETQFYNITCLV